MADEPRYDDRDTALILRMAAELDHRPAESASGHRARGQSLSEIERIAEEAGIRPESVRRAATALAAELESRGSFLGAPTRFRHQRVVPGVLDDDDRGEVFRSLSWETGKAGEVTYEAGVTRWEHSTEEGPLIRVELDERDDETRIRLLGNWQGPADWTIVGGGAAAIGAAIATTVGVDGSALVFFGSLAGYSAASWWGTRRVWRRISNRVESRLSSLMDALTDRARSLAATSPAAGDPGRPGETRPSSGSSGTAERGSPTAPAADEPPT